MSRISNIGGGSSSSSGGVSSIAKSGSTALTGAVTLSEGANITLTQVGQDIAIASTASGSGNVVGPASATDSNFAAFDTTTGKLIKDSGVTSSSFQSANAILAALAGLSYASGTPFVKMTGASAFSLDTSTYLTTVTAHNILSTTHGDTLADSVVRGDILYGNATPKWARLAFPASPTGKLLQATATDVAWSTNPLTIGTSASVSGSNTGDQTISDATISVTNITTNNASTSAHGFEPIAIAPAAGNLNVEGIANTETVRSDKLLLDATSPSTQAFGDAAAAGTSLKAARIDHKHAMMTAPTTATTQAASDNSTKIATTAYVTTGISNAIAGVNPAVAVQAATTAAGDTSGLTYNNGVAGVGATFTGSLNTAIVFDGHTLVLNDRVLIKNDTQSPSGAFNGVYLVTTIQSVGVAPILTRATDYNQPSDINNTGAIPVVLGTANAQTTWVLTSTVTTVGTDPLTFTQFSLKPSTIVTLTGSQALTNKTITDASNTVNANTLLSYPANATPTANNIPVLDANAYLPKAAVQSLATVTVASVTTSVAINADITGTYEITAQAGAVLFSNPTGTLVNNQKLIIKIIDNGTARAITWGTNFRAMGTALPSTTVLSKHLVMGFIYNITDTKWDCVAASQEV